MNSLSRKRRFDFRVSRIRLLCVGASSVGSQRHRLRLRDARRRFVPIVTFAAFAFLLHTAASPLRCDADEAKDKKAAAAAQASAPSAAQEPASQPVDPDHVERIKQGTDLFRREVRALLTGRCLNCHGGESVEGEFDLSTREGLLRGGTEGKAVVPGKSAESRLVRLIAHEEEPEMPQESDKLTDNAIAAIRHWIDLGAPYDKPLVESDANPDAWTASRIDPAAREFWSFQPLAKVAPPAVDSVWVRGDVDRFVAAKHAEKKVTPNGVADRRTLIRRAYFDLIGLPPTAAEVEAFVNSDDPQAYEKLIDRMLESPHYGERWGRHWLDIARFAESHGFEQDYDRPHAYHYRDFVIRALNDDMPFDQFVRWQIAGDEIAPDDPLAMMATGFLGAGVFPTQLTEKEFEPARYDELDDMVNTLGTSMLGLTIGCARCHDHKFDPIPRADYYRMIATFATTIRSEIDLDLNSDEHHAALAKWEAEHEPLVAAVREYEQRGLKDRFVEWQNSEAVLNGSFESMADWVVLEPVEFKSAGGAKAQPLGDHSLLFTGPNPNSDEYTLSFESPVTSIRTIRLEVLPHESMPKNGPGRADNGNFALSRIQAELTPEPVGGAAPPSVKLNLQAPRATFQQNESSLSIAASLDDDDKSGWAVDPEFGKRHAALFSVPPLESPVAGPRARLTMRLRFYVNTRHAPGRVRISVSPAEKPGFDGNEIPGRAADAVRQLAGSGSALILDEPFKSALETYFKSLDPEWAKRNDALQAHVAAKPQPKMTKVMVTSEGFKPIPHHADGRGFPHFYPQTYFLNRGDATQKIAPAVSGFLQALMQPPARPFPDVPAESAGVEKDGNANGDAIPNGDPNTSSDAADRGDSDADEVVDPASLRLASLSAYWQRPAPEGSRTSHRRLAMADWITDTEHGAGHLLARVIVNRLWQHHFGRGIVSTPNDFGYQGTRPSHPELLDWLASELIANGWRLKPLHRRLMTSAAYMQTSDADDADSQTDPDNQFVWRFSPRRLEAEVIRDAMLAVAGELDQSMYGPGTLDGNMKRRSIYFMVKRSKLVPMMQIFDAPEPLVSVGDRPATTIAPQALHFMNNDQVRAAARSMARRLRTDHPDAATEALLDSAYAAALGRPPSDSELAAASAFIESQIASYQADGQQSADELALTDVCQVLFGLNEFIFVD